MTQIPAKPISTAHTYCPPGSPECTTLKLKDLDGNKDTGVFKFFNTAHGDFSYFNGLMNARGIRVSSLLAEDNTVSVEQTDVFKTEQDRFVCKNDWGLVGDPDLLRKEKNYKPEALSKSTRNGFITLWETGSEQGRKLTLNSHLETINKEGRQAFTQYGMVIQDDQKAKTTVRMVGGQTQVRTPDGQTKILIPGREHIVGDPKDPVARIYFAKRPGGENGKMETRLVVEQFEKPSAATVHKLMNEGMSRAEAEKLRMKKEANFGFRIPDQRGAFRAPEGVTGPNPITKTRDGVKTYYDAHFVNNDCLEIPVCKEPPPPPPPPPPPVATHQKSRIWGDPHVEGADGERYDFHEKGLFNVLSDKGVSLVAETVAGPGVTSVIRNSGLTVGSNKVLVSADGSVSINGQAVAEQANVSLGNGSTLTRNRDITTVVTPEYRFVFDALQSYKGATYMDVDVHSGAAGVFADGVLPTGILGETYDADNIALNRLKNPLASYVRSSLFASAGA